MRAPPPYQLADGRWALGALGAVLLTIGTFTARWELVLGGLACSALAVAAVVATRWWQRGYDAWHPYGFDLEELARRQPQATHEELSRTAGILDATRAEAAELADALSLAIGPSRHASLEGARLELLALSNSLAATLRAVALGALPERWWAEEATSALALHGDVWQRGWPERARDVRVAVEILARPFHV